MILSNDVTAGIISVVVAAMPVILALIKKDIRKLTLNINGRIDELLTVAKVVARREGYDEGRSHGRKDAQKNKSDFDDVSRRTRRASPKTSR